MAKPVHKHVGSRVRMRRLMLDMTQTQLGDALGLTFKQVQNYEKGRDRIGAGRLQHISQILQVTVPFFFEGAPPSVQLKLAEQWLSRSPGEPARSADGPHLR